MSSTLIADDLLQLYELFRRLCRSRQTPRSPALVESIILHPQSQQRLRAACGTVMKHWAGRPDLLGDVMQQATLLLTEVLLHGSLPYQDEGSDRFGGWLWRVWSHACARAWVTCQPFWLRQVALRDTQQLDELSALRHSENTLTDLWLAIAAEPDLRQRSLLQEWAHGFTSAESAQRHGLCERTIERLRKRALHELRGHLR